MIYRNYNIYDTIKKRRKMEKRDYDKISFKGVGLAFILFGAITFAFALTAWFLQFMEFATTDVAFPFFKAIGAAIVIGIGYIILEIELMRKK